MCRAENMSRARWSTAGGSWGGVGGKSPFLQTWILPPPSRSKTSGDVLATAGFVAGCGSGACRYALAAPAVPGDDERSEEHTSELQSHLNLVCRLLLEKKKQKTARQKCSYEDPARALRSHRYSLS